MLRWCGHMRDNADMHFFMLPRRAARLRRVAARVSERGPSSRARVHFGPPAPRPRPVDVSSAKTEKNEQAKMNLLS